MRKVDGFKLRVLKRKLIFVVLMFVLVPVMPSMLLTEMAFFRFNVVNAFFVRHRLANDAHWLLVHLYWLLNNSHGLLGNLHRLADYLDCLPIYRDLLIVHHRFAALDRSVTRRIRTHAVANERTRYCANSSGKGSAIATADLVSEQPTSYAADEGAAIARSGRLNWDLLVPALLPRVFNGSILCRTGEYWKGKNGYRGQKSD
jgi:hypothetical protein